MALTSNQRNAVLTLGHVNASTGSIEALTYHALSLGMSESTVDAQHTKAIAAWQAILAGGGLDPNQTTAINDAITHLQRRQAALRNPLTAVPSSDR